MHQDVSAENSATVVHIYWEPGHKVGFLEMLCFQSGRKVGNDNNKNDDVGAVNHTFLMEKLT